MSRREWVMLAHTIDWNKDRIAGRLMSEKLDGQRAIWDGGITRGLPVGDVPWANTAKDHRLTEPNYEATGLWSRYGKVIRAPGWFLNGMPPFPMDGELWMGVKSYQELRSIVSRHEPDDRWRNVKFYAFDWPCYLELFAEGRVVSGAHYEKLFGPEIKEFVQSRLIETRCHDLFAPNQGIAQRYLKYSEMFDVGATRWRMHEQERLPMQTDAAIERVHEKMDEVLNKGGEGLVLRSAHSTWKPKRTRDLLKIKPYSDAEAVVVGYTWGKETDKGSRLLGLMGTLVVQWHDITFEIGSGFTDEERELSKIVHSCPGLTVHLDVFNPTFPRGSTITFKYRELSNDGVPKEGTYYRKR